MSNAYSRILHTYDLSMVVPISKTPIKDIFTNMFKERGYKVIDLDFAHPEKCKVGYEPLDYIARDEDAIQLARTLVDNNEKDNNHKNVDPYWADSATSILAAEIELTRLNAKSKKQKPSFYDVVALHRSIHRLMDSNAI